MKLSLSNRVPRDYNAATFQEIVRFLEEQSNLHAEGKLRARHGAMTSAPTSGNWEKGDFVWNSNPSVGAGSSLLFGWECTTSGTPGTWQRCYLLTEIVPFLGTEVASTSGTSIDFTGIPSWVRRIVVEFVGVSTNGTSDLVIQIGDSGGVETTGYLSAYAAISGASTSSANSTSAFVLAGLAAASTIHGQVTLVLEAGSTWTVCGALAHSNTAIVDVFAGSKSLSDTLDRVRITTAGGTDTFDAGAINILYE